MDEKYKTKKLQLPAFMPRTRKSRKAAPTQTRRHKPSVVVSYHTLPIEPDALNYIKNYLKKNVRPENKHYAHMVARAKQTLNVPKRNPTASQIREAIMYDAVLFAWNSKQVRNRVVTKQAIQYQLTHHPHLLLFFTPNPSTTLLREANRPLPETTPWE